MKRKILVLMCLLSITLFVGCGQITSPQPDPREREIIVFLNENKYDEAREIAKKLYDGEDKRLREILVLINESEEINKQRVQIRQQSKQTVEKYNPSAKLEIQQGHRYEVRGDYIYINGKIRNVSNSIVTYFEVRVDFMDDIGQVLDSDYTNDGLTLNPGDMREFEIMHRLINYKTYKLSIGDVK